jgi:hypothetical protein
MAKGYQYWLLRYVPDTIRGEFVNIGVIVGRDGGDWALEHVRSFARASRLGGDASQSRQWLEELRFMIARANGTDTFAETSLLSAHRSSHLMEYPMSANIIDHMSARLNNAVQLSEARPVHTDNAGQTARQLYELLVLESPHIARTRARTQIIRQIGTEFSQIPGLDEREIRKNSRAHIGRQTQKFDFALGADRVRQMTQVLSFTRKNLDDVNQEVMAWSHAVSRLRNKGGELEIGATGRTLQILPDVPIRVVHDEPKNTKQRDQLEIARESWQDLGVQDYTPDNIHRLAVEVQRLVA